MGPSAAPQQVCCEPISPDSVGWTNGGFGEGPDGCTLLNKTRRTRKIRVAR